MRIPFARVLWIGAAGIVVLAALVALVAIVDGSFSDDDVRILATLAALLYAGATGLAGLAVAERGPGRLLGRIVAAVSPVALALVLWAIWGLGAGDDEPQVKLAWSSVLVLLAALMATTALLLARRPGLVRLAWASGGLAGLATALSLGGIWAGHGGDALLKALAALWILAALAYFLVPILGRFSSAGTATTRELRVLAELDGVELVATHSADGLDVRLAPGERLVLRRRS